MFSPPHLDYILYHSLMYKHHKISKHVKCLPIFLVLESRQFIKMRHNPKIDVIQDEVNRGL